jgi:hypothetical protein
MMLTLDTDFASLRLCCVRIDLEACKALGRTLAEDAPEDAVKASLEALAESLRSHGQTVSVLPPNRNPIFDSSPTGFHLDSFDHRIDSAA